jgi:TonB family protein
MGHALMRAVLLAATLAVSPAAAEPFSGPPLPNQSPGLRHSCESFYPPGPLLNNVEGKTIVGFTVDPTGHVVEPAVKESSGNADLDDAAKKCVLRWIYRPALKDRVPIAVPWQAAVIWKQTYHLAFVSAPSCTLPAQARTQPPATKTTIAFTVAADGVTDDIHVRTSSGDASLDKAVSDCVAAWRLEPRKDADGNPVPYHTSDTVTWTPPD